METKTGLGLNEPLCFFAHQDKWRGGRAETFGCFFCGRNYFVKSAILKENTFLQRPHFDIVPGVFSSLQSCFFLGGGNHLISMQNRFSFCCSSSLSSTPLPVIREEAGGNSLSLSMAESACGLAQLMRHCSWKVCFTSEQSVPQSPGISAKPPCPGTHPSLHI